MYSVQQFCLSIYVIVFNELFYRIIGTSARNVLNFEIQKWGFYDFLGLVYGTYFPLFQAVLDIYQNSKLVF